MQFVRGFKETGAIFDEFQYVPEITKALKVVADEIIKDHRKYKTESRTARFILKFLTPSFVLISSK